MSAGNTGPTSFDNANMSSEEAEADAHLTHMSILCALVAALSFALHSLFYKLVLVHFEIDLT